MFSLIKKGSGDPLSSPKRIAVALVAVFCLASFAPDAEACGRGRLRGIVKRVVRPVKAAAGVVKQSGGNCKGGSCTK